MWLIISNCTGKPWVGTYTVKVATGSGGCNLLWAVGVVIWLLVFVFSSLQGPTARCVICNKGVCVLNCSGWRWKLQNDDSWENSSPRETGCIYTNEGYNQKFKLGLWEAAFCFLLPSKWLRSRPRWSSPEWWAGQVHGGAATCVLSMVFPALQSALGQIPVNPPVLSCASFRKKVTCTNLIWTFLPLCCDAVKKWL